VRTKAYEQVLLPAYKEHTVDWTYDSRTNASAVIFGMVVRVWMSSDQRWIGQIDVDGLLIIHADFSAAEDAQAWCLTQAVERWQRSK
jgi:hypothetical protein